MNKTSFTFYRELSLPITSNNFHGDKTMLSKTKEGRSAITVNFTANVMRNSSCCFRLAASQSLHQKNPPAGPPAPRGDTIQQQVQKEKVSLPKCGKIPQEPPRSKNDDLEFIIVAQTPV